MNRQDLISLLVKSADNGHLITVKHDQSNISNIYPHYRSIVCMTSQDFSDFLKSGEFSISEYANTNPSHPSHYYEITPNDPNLVPGSGILPYSTIPTVTCDRFIVVSGIRQGWHIFTEASLNIQQLLNSGNLVHVANL